MNWMKKHPYLTVTLGCLFLIVLMALLAGLRLPLPDPEAFGSLIGIAWLISMVGIMLVRALRKRAAKN